MVYVVTEAEEKRRIARLILEALPEWFGITEARNPCQIYVMSLS